MNIYNEAKNYFEELLNNIDMDNYEKEEIEEMTLNELIIEDDYRTEYLYSVYNGTLFEVIANNLNLLGYAEELENEFGQGIAANPLIINEAIYRYMIDLYGDKTADYFNS